MSEGTTINGLYVPRVHKRSAATQAEDAEDMLRYYHSRLLVLAATSPHNVDEGDGPMPWDFYVQREIDGMWEEILDAARERFLAGYIAECPDECSDSLENVE